MAEALTLKEALQIAKNLGMESIIFERDRKDLLESVFEKNKNRHVSNIIPEINSLKSSITDSSLTWINK